MAKRAVFFRQNRRWRVVPHGCQCFFAILCHWGKDLLNLFNAVASGNLTFEQLFTAEQLFFSDLCQRFIKVFDFANPLTKWLGRGQFIFDLGVVVQRAFGHIDRQQLTRAKRAFFTHNRLICGNHAHLGPCDQQTITRDDIAQWAQTIAIQTRTDPAPVGHGKCGRTIPWFHHRVTIGIHITPCLWQILGLF